MKFGRFCCNCSKLVYYWSSDGFSSFALYFLSGEHMENVHLARVGYCVDDNFPRFRLVVGLKENSKKKKSREN